MHCIAWPVALPPQSLTVTPLTDLLQVFNLVDQFCQLKVCRCCCGDRGRKRALAAQPVPVSYGTMVARHLLIFVVGIVYSSMSPLMLPFAIGPSPSIAHPRLRDSWRAVNGARLNVARCDGTRRATVR